MQIRVLGPVEVLVDGHARPLPAAGERELLAVLALAAGRVVPVPALIDALWGEQLPANPGDALQVRVSKLRRALTAAGHVRVNGTRVIAASHLLRRGDVVTLALDRSVRLLRVESFSERRGDASAARRLYHFEAQKS